MALSPAHKARNVVVVVVVLSSTHLLQMVGLFELEMIAQKVICVRERM